MTNSPPFVDAVQLRAATFVRHVEVHDTLGSTNDRAAELAAELPSDASPALVVARQQTAGRGRGTHSWWSADGALTFSLLIDPAAFGISTAKWPQLSLTTAVAVCDALASENSPPSKGRAGGGIVGLKWPNDVLIAGRKVCGILIESPGGPAPAKNRLIFGIGINVNNSWRNAPPEVANAGTSLSDVTGRCHDLQTVLVGTLIAIESRIRQLESNEPMLALEWQKLSVLTGQTIAIEVEQRQTTGKCLEVARDGALVVETMLGRQSFYSGSVRQLP
jgi:BirA family transcriptional regulator, biotin operon repressor / biotin---[acetyl-CoA-carboxylase] ligase